MVIRFARVWLLAAFCAGMGLFDIQSAFGGVAVLSPPSGWTAQVSGGELNWLQSTSSGSNVLIAFDPAERSAQPLRTWFDAKIVALGKEGRIIQRSGISAEPGMVKDVLVAETPGLTVRVFAFAWETTLGKQVAFVTTDRKIDPSDRVVQSAFDAVAGVWRQGGAVNRSLSLTATIARPADRSAPQQTERTTRTAPRRDSGGGRCHDVTRLRTVMQTQMQCNPATNSCAMVTLPVSAETTQTECN